MRLFPLEDQSPAAARPHEILKVADLTFDLHRLLIQRGPRSISLGPMGMRILAQLMRASPGVVTRDQLDDAVWDGRPPATHAALRGHISLIRGAIETDGERKLLHTLHRIGYRLA